MSERYSWKQMPSCYYASYYNDVDFSQDRRFIVIDNLTKYQYYFPKKIINERIIIDRDLWNQDFFNWICRTAPDFCINIPEEFMTPKLIDICIDNASKPEFLKAVKFLTQDQCTRFVKRLPSSVKYAPDGFKTKEMAIDVLEKFSELLIHFPKELVTPDLRQKCYDKVSPENRVVFIAKGYMEDLITSDMLLDLVENGVVFKKSLGIDFDVYFWPKIPEKIFTKEIAKKIITACGRCISIIPKEFQIFEVQKLAIDQGYRNIQHIKEEYLSDDIIKYALNKNGIAICFIPTDKRTKEICELAVKNNAKALKHVPEEHKTYEMCLDAATFFPKLIEVVPVHILNRQFLLDLENRKVVIPEKYMKYVEECIELHDKTKGIINPNYQDDDLEKLQNEIPIEIRNININNVSGYFSSFALKRITEYGITNLGELFTRVRTIEFIKHFREFEVYDEVINTISLLRCKYFKEKPAIDLNDEELSSEKFYKLLGLSRRSYKSLERGYFCNNAKEFFEKMRKEKPEENFGRIRNIGDSSILEIIQKANIVINYYDELEKQDESSKSSESIDDELRNLYNELENLEQQKKGIENQINIAMAKIEKKEKEKETNKSKGGVARLTFENH